MGSTIALPETDRKHHHNNSSDYSRTKDNQEDDWRCDTGCHCFSYTILFWLASIDLVASKPV